MPKLEKIAALVPMRHSSERVPGKNYRELVDKPLYAHIISTLMEVPEINTIVVDTDSPVIIEGLKRDYPSVVTIERPEHLRAGTIPMNEILMYDTGQVSADLYLQTHSTNPLLGAQTLSAAIRFLREHYPAYDSLFGVTRIQARLWDQLVRPVNHNPAILLRTQDLPPMYMENSCVYLFTRQTLEQRRNRIGERPHMFEINPAEAWDIDEEITFRIVEQLMQQKKIS
jgi:CMP-N-acetylneuraminic acid synthetase